MKPFRRAGHVASLVLGLAGCGSWESVPDATPDAREAFSAPHKAETMSPADVLRAFQEDTVTDYRIGDGDQVNIDVVGRAELSGPQVVGPDGNVTLPVVGNISVRNLTREQAASAISKALGKYYRDPFTTVRVLQYASNRVTVLGRVEHPGPVPFDTPPTLLEILSKAGVFPLIRPEQVLTSCAVIRRDRILWVDIGRLLGGDLQLNVQLHRNDVVYIPDASDRQVFVLGAVNKPGAYRLTSRMSFVDALGQAGGATPEAHKNEIHLIRPEKGVNLQVSFDEVMKPDPNLSLALEHGDIIYVPMNTAARIGYVLQKVNPFMQAWMIRQMGTM
ncbi:polysaccharide biosynthesis/export family protein [Methylococcus geothermalis]|uniref:Polysaccharide export protein n=1 Tax=Methylococcus geothermalis TaxID=2681310 RepID=A0A858Q975_9GAMM|nr:polysaccharide biosynthesis/export family protein [Methylococcus geothermalis]QJD30387.1 polysaccharide export protein [Methylococcus geothermalis]